MFQKGMAYPFKIENGKTKMTNPDSLAGISEIVSGSIEQIFLTSLGTRVMLPKFGSKVADLVFDNIDSDKIGLIKFLMIETISKYEQRIQITGIRFIVGDKIRVECYFIIPDLGESGKFDFVLNL